MHTQTQTYTATSGTPKGFMVIERICVVVAVMAILAALVLPAVRSHGKAHTSGIAAKQHRSSVATLASVGIG